MGLFKLQIRELAKEERRTLKAISTQANAPRSTVATYANSSSANSSSIVTADIPAVIIIAQMLGAAVEELVEVIEE